MGLDNGVTIRSKTNDYSKILKLFNYSSPFSNSYGVEIIYFRKCWNVREIFLNILDPENENQCCYNINREDIPLLQKRFQSLFNPESWDGDNSIWTYDEILSQLLDSYVNLQKLYDNWDSDWEVTFYDSY